MKDKCCGLCEHGRKSGFSMIYCVFYGINISREYERCRLYKSRIKEVGDDQIIKVRAGPAAEKGA